MSVYVFHDKPSLDELTHYGVKGMRWGIRKDKTTGVSRKTSRDASKDAREFARAKMFYGEGAGTRRKLIKATVEAKSKKDPDYKKAFDIHLERQDLSKHASRARSERKRKDVGKGAAKTARGISHMIRGNTRYASALAAGLFAAAAAAHKAGIDRVVLNTAKTTVRNVKNSNRIKAGMPASEFIKKMGF